MAASVTPAEAPGWVGRHLAARPGTRWVGIDGFGAAGKTSLSHRIAAGLPGAYVVSVDDFARGAHPGWDRDLFAREVLEPLLAGRPARYQHWDLGSDTGGGWVEVPPGVPVLVEGVSATDRRLAVPWDLLVWVDATEDVRRSRILARDAPALLERWQHDWWPSEQAYGGAQQPWLRADLVVSGPVSVRRGRSADQLRQGGVQGR